MHQERLCGLKAALHCLLPAKSLFEKTSGQVVGLVGSPAFRACVKNKFDLRKSLTSFCKCLQKDLVFTVFAIFHTGSSGGFGSRRLKRNAKPEFLTGCKATPSLLVILMLGTMQTLKRLMARSRQGATLRDCFLAFLCAGRASMGANRHVARRIFERLVGAFAREGRIRLSLIGPQRGVTLLLRPGNVADYLVAGERVLGAYEIPPSAFQRTPTRIVDGGANIGTFTLYAASLFPSVPLVCYEPEEANAALLKETIAANGIQAVVVEKGLWSRVGRLFFHPGESYSGFVNEIPSQHPIETVLVDAPDGCWLKLDIEGAEYEVLPQLLRSGCRPAVISLEIHDINGRGPELIGLLSEARYRVTGDWKASDSCAEVAAFYVEKHQ